VGQELKEQEVTSWSNKTDVLS